MGDTPASPQIDSKAFEYYRRLKRVNEYVERSALQDISLARAAQVAHMETKSFSKFFRRIVGIRFSEWLAHLRIAKARELIEGSNRSLTTIALDVGYGDLRSFERTFKKLSGMTALQYKRRIQAELTKFPRSRGSLSHL